MRKKVTRLGVPVRIIETGEEFSSIQACALHLGVSYNYLQNVVSGRKNARYTCRGYHVVRSDGCGPCVDLSKKGNIGRPGIPVRIVETGEEFDSIQACADAIGGNPARICEIVCHKPYRHTHLGLTFEKIYRV